MYIFQVVALHAVFETNVGSCALRERAKEVGVLETLLAAPGKLLLVGEDTRNESGTVVAA